MYAKIFRQIFESSIAENPRVRFTFMDLLILADQNGVVDMTHEAIARITNRPLDEIRETIAILEQPDGKSRTPGHEGARIVRLDGHRDWGWWLTGYERFRAIANERERRENTKINVQRLKDRQSAQNLGKQATNNSLLEIDLPYASPSASASPELEGKEGVVRGRFQKPTIESVRLQCAKIGLPKDEADKFFNYYESNGWRVGKNPMKLWTAALANWKKHWQEFSKEHSYRGNGRSSEDDTPY